jgi:phage FluMu protein Com
MFERFFEHDTKGALKGLTLEWKCPQCEGLNFRILIKGQRASGEYHTRCRYCRAKFRVVYSGGDIIIPGEAEFLGMLDKEDFPSEERTEMIRDFAEIEYMKRDDAAFGAIAEKEKALEEKVAVAKRMRR